jgi:hypothetical protein
MNKEEQTICHHNNSPLNTFFLRGAKHIGILLLKQFKQKTYFGEAKLAQF